MTMTTMNSPDFPLAQSPEQAGLSSRSVQRFLETLEQARTCIHGFLIIRHGQVVAEGYWPPFSAARKHRMYSVSKSFVSLAVGLMIDEGKLRLDDRVARFFPDKTPADLHPYLAEATVRDLLMMATPHSENSYGCSDADFAWTFFNKKPTHPPGTIFSYDTAATVVLGTIVERISGQPFLEYMRPRLLDPIGFSPDAWCVRTPEGTSWGGSGVICTLRDMARLATVCLNRGRWGDRQLISAAYIDAATARQIDNSLIHGNTGYGYQIWREKHNGFSFRGMGSQFAYCFPDRDFIFACIADTQGDGPTGTDIEDAMWREIYAQLSDAPLPEDPPALARLREKIASLAWVPQDGERQSPTSAQVSGRWYQLNENPMGITRTRLIFNASGDKVLWEYTNGQGDNRLELGIGCYAADHFPQLNYFGSQIGTIPGLRYDCQSSAAWVEPEKLAARVYITDNYLGTLKMTMAFKGDEIAIHMTKVAEWFLDEYQGFAGGKAAQPR